MKPAVITNPNLGVLILKCECVCVWGGGHTPWTGHEKHTLFTHTLTPRGSFTPPTTVFPFFGWCGKLKSNSLRLLMLSMSAVVSDSVHIPHFKWLGCFQD